MHKTMDCWLQYPNLQISNLQFSTNSAIKNKNLSVQNHSSGQDKVSHANNACCNLHYKLMKHNCYIFIWVIQHITICSLHFSHKGTATQGFQSNSELVNLGYPVCLCQNATLSLPSICSNVLTCFCLSFCRFSVCYNLYSHFLALLASRVGFCIAI